MNVLSTLDRVSLNKAAVDAGFDVSEGDSEGWLMYASTSSPVRVALAVIKDQPVGALTSLNVLGELRVPVLSGSTLPSGAVGGFVAKNFGELQEILSRAYLLARTLPDELLHSWQDAVKNVGATERDATVKQRIGQDFFRRGLLALWDGRCAITGLAVPKLLRASHAKPWKDASDAERLDVYNGLLLAAHLDAAFDAGLIGVAADGEVMISTSLDSDTRKMLGLASSARIERLSARHQRYLKWHRENVFLPD